MIYLGSDHAGVPLKREIARHLKDRGIDFRDLGTDSQEPIDYPDIAEKVAKEVRKHQGHMGILICGTGIGMCIAANKLKGIRAAQCYDEFTAGFARTHNDANILCLRGRNFPIEKSKQVTDIFLGTKFSTDARHKRRIKKIEKLQNG